MDLIARHDTPITQSLGPMRAAATRRRAADAHLGAALRELSPRPRATRTARRSPAAVVAARPTPEMWQR